MIAPPTIGPTCQDYDDCQLLQLIDILVGGFRTVLGSSTNDVHREVCKPSLELAERWLQGSRRMRNSKWSNGFCISEAFIENCEWRFTSIERPPHFENHRLF